MDTKQGSKGLIPRGRYDAGNYNESVSGKTGWFVVSIRGPVKDNFVELVRKQILNDPFFGIYRIVDARQSTGDKVYIYMKYTPEVLRLLNSEAMGAATVKKETGGTQALAVTPVSDEEMYKSRDWLDQGAGIQPKSNIKKCFAGSAFKDQAMKAVQQIEKEGIKVVEYVNTIIKSVKVNSENGSNSWVFGIQVGYLYGLTSEYELENPQEIGAFTVNNIDIMSNPVTNTVEKAFPNLEEEPGVLNGAKMLEFANIVDKEAKNFVATTFRNSNVEKIAADMSGAPQTVTVPAPTESGAVGAPQQEESAEPVKYKIEDYRLEFGYQGNINIVMDISVDGKVYTNKISLWNETLGSLITQHGIDAVSTSIDNEVEQYFGMAPYIIRGSDERQVQMGNDIIADKVNNGRRYFRIYNIDTQKLVQDNS